MQGSLCEKPKGENLGSIQVDKAMEIGKDWCAEVGQGSSGPFPHSMLYVMPSIQLFLSYIFPW